MAVMVKSASEMHEQSLPFVLVAAGEEEEKKNVILGFHGFYRGGPYSFIFFSWAETFFNFLHLSPKTVLGLKNPSFRPNFNWA